MYDSNKMPWYDDGQHIERTQFNVIESERASETKTENNLISGLECERQ